MAVVATGAGGAEAWSGMLADAVVKCGRDSERKLYMYGISVNRCPKCQVKLRAESDTCASCHYTHKTQRKCLRCNKSNEPVMWCAECDEYFCSTCHKKPHVLMLGSSKPHHCFAIDGASGKYFVAAAWAGDFTAMVQSTYRQRRREKIAADEVKEKAPTQATTGQQPTPVVVTQAPSTKSTSTDVPPTTAATAVNAIGGLSSASTVTATPASTVQEQSRKRQLSGPDDKREKKLMRGKESSHSGGKSGAASTEFMSLYERVKAMHDQRAKTARSNTAQAKSPKMSMNQILSQQNEEKMREQEEQEKRKSEQALQQQRDQNRRQEEERVERLKIEQQQQKELQRQEEKRQQEEQRLQEKRLQEKRLQEVQRRLEEQRRIQEEKRLQKEQRLLEELQRENEKQLREEQQRQEAKRREEELRQREEERLREELRKQKQIQEEKRQRLIEEQTRHEENMRQQEETRRQTEAQSLMREGNRFVSQAQQVLHAQPGYAVSSLAPPTISQTSSDRFMRVPSPASIPPRFQASSSPSHTSQGFQTQSTHGAPISSGFLSEHGSQVYQGHTGAPVSRFETISHDHEENQHMVVRESSQRQQQQSDYSDAMVPHRMTGGAASGGFSPSKSGEDDELRAIWVSDYDNDNALVMQLDVEISKRTEEGHSFVHRSNNITIPEQLKLQINNLRAQRDAAIKKRFESVVRVLIFSDAVRSFAQQNEHTNIWSDVPEVQKASHKKCAELASDIREFERQAQKLREGIDEAVSSGNPEQMQNVAHLGALIADLEQKIRASNGEREKQFIFMFQFSDTLRNMVRAEWAASGRIYQLQGSQ
ncbi:hypothetical protein V7S43_008327 [Phytophthora oleae]|uniref:B box-type domain-containing protein n=1 Tax=Phytophthora oleae TaxID=2107226 RepID=A0ABD3FLV0_9STRA